MVQDVLMVSDIDTLKVISDPLRIQILDNIRMENNRGVFNTVKQLSETLNLPTSKLYYHISMLEKYGLIRVAETRLISGIVEKHYQVCAHDIIVDRQLFAANLAQDEKTKAMIALVDSTLDATRSDFLSMLNAIGTQQELPIRISGRRGHISRNLVCMTPLQSEAFYERLLALLDEFDQSEAHISGEEAYIFNLTTLFVPVKQNSASPKTQGNNP